MRHVEHDRIDAAALDEGAELVLDIFGLLTRKPRHRIIAAIAFARETVARLAIIGLPLEAAFGRDTPDALPSGARRREGEGERNRAKHGDRNLQPHDLPPPMPSFVASRRAAAARRRTTCKETAYCCRSRYACASCCRCNRFHWRRSSTFPRSSTGNAYRRARSWRSPKARTPGRPC